MKDYKEYGTVKNGSIVNDSENMKLEDDNTIVGATQVSHAFCPPSCFFAKCHACYAMYGNCNFHFRKLSDGREGKPIYEEFEETAKKIKRWRKIPQFMRLNVMGDFCSGDKLGESLLKINHYWFKECVNIPHVWGYTHAPITPVNIMILRKYNNVGFVIRKSCELLSDVFSSVSLGVPASLVVESMTGKTKKVGKLTFVKCPATYDKSRHCASCGLCQSLSRYTVPVFPVHGQGRENAIKTGILLKW